MPTIDLTDDFHQDEPLGYLVKNHDTTMHEYAVFADLDEAESHAERQEDLADEADESEDCEIYPLYAGHPIGSPLRKETP